MALVGEICLLGVTNILFHCRLHSLSIGNESVVFALNGMSSHADIQLLDIHTCALSWHCVIIWCRTYTPNKKLANVQQQAPLHTIGIHVRVSACVPIASCLLWFMIENGIFLPACLYICNDVSEYLHWFRHKLTEING